MQYLYLYLFYLGFVVSIVAYRSWQKGTLNTYNRILFVPVLIGFYLIDVTINWTLLWVMGKPPKGITISDRFEFYRQNDKGLRGKLAAFICEKLLNNVDPTGQHC